MTGVVAEILIDFRVFGKEEVNQWALAICSSRNKQNGLSQDFERVDRRQHACRPPRRIWKPKNSRKMATNGYLKKKHKFCNGLVLYLCLVGVLFFSPFAASSDPTNPQDQASTIEFGAERRPMRRSRKVPIFLLGDFQGKITDRRRRPMPANFRRPASDVNACTPRVLDHVIGQKNAVELIQTGLNAAWNDATRFPHTLMTSEPGLGKTLFARIISAEMGVELKEALAQTFCFGPCLNGFVMSANDKDVLFIDEGDELEGQIQTLLYRLLEDKKIFVSGTRETQHPHSIPLRDFTVILATNHEGSLVKPLRDRFKLVLRFEPYSPDELARILRQRADGLHWIVENEVLSRISSKGRGVPRVALRLLESCRRTSRAVNKHNIDLDDYHRTMQLEGLDDGLGLDRTEQEYLNILAESNKPIRLQTISRRLGVPAKSVSTVLETYLVRQGLISATDAGRELTPQGFEYLRSRDDSS